MNQLIRRIRIERAYLARLFPLCNYFAEDDISISVKKRNIVFGGMNPKSSFEFAITPNKSLSEFFGENSEELVDIRFTVSKEDFSKILAPFSRSGGFEQPKKDMDMVTLEIWDSGIKIIQENLDHISEEINIKTGDGTWIPLPNETWEFTLLPDMLSEYIHRMAASGGVKIKFKQEGNTLWVISVAGKEKFPLEASKSLTNQIDVSRIILNNVKVQLNDYGQIKVGVRKSYLMIEGKWNHSVCKWKLDAIEVPNAN